jgi:hypothetical protein
MKVRVPLYPLYQTEEQEQTAVLPHNTEQTMKRYRGERYRQRERGDRQMERGDRQMEMVYRQRARV